MSPGSGARSLTEVTAPALTVDSSLRSLMTIPRLNASAYAGLAMQTTRDPARFSNPATTLPIAPAPKMIYLVDFSMLIGSDNIALPVRRDKARKTTRDDRRKNNRPENQLILQPACSGRGAGAAASVDRVTRLRRQQGVDDGSRSKDQLRRLHHRVGARPERVFNALRKRADQTEDRIRMDDAIQSRRDHHASSSDAAVGYRTNLRRARRRPASHIP